MKRFLPILLAIMLVAGCSIAEPVKTGSEGETPMPTNHSQSGTENISTLSRPAPILEEMPELKDADKQAYIQAADELSKALLEENGNSAVTPLSLYIALSMLAGGAEGETQQQLCALLGMDAAQLAEFNKGLMQLCNYETMQTVNSLWVQQGWPVEQDYLSLLSEQFYAWANETNFSDGSGAEQISAWINEQTEGMISPQMQLPEGTSLVLANATLLMDEWVNNFDKAQTEEQDFHAPDGDVKVDMMKRDKLGATQWVGDGYRAISLPLKYNEMLFLLPDEGIDPYTLLRDKGLSTLFNLDNKAKSEYHEIEVSIPKFDIASSGSANDALQALGIENAFDLDNAEFTPISSEPLWVGDIAQGTRVIVHEDGVAAAGYTTIAMGGAAPEQEMQQPFILDRPFLFCITRTGLPMFTGIVNQPNEPNTVTAPGPEMENGIPVKAKEKIEKTIEEYFRLQAEIDAHMKESTVGPNENSQIGDVGTTSEQIQQLQNLLDNMELYADIDYINSIKLSYFAKEENTEPPTQPFKVEFGQLTIAENNEQATQQIKIANDKGEAEIEVTLSNIFGDSEWRITNIEIPTNLLGTVEQQYYQHKTDYQKENPTADTEKIWEYIKSKFNEQ